MKLFYFLVACFILSINPMQASAIMRMGTPPPDTLVYVNGSKKPMTLIRLTDETIEYKDVDNDVIRVVPSTEISMIKYHDGNKIVINSAGIAKPYEPIGKRAFNWRMAILGAGILYRLITVFSSTYVSEIGMLVIALAFLIANLVCFAKAVKSLQIYQKFPHKYRGRLLPVMVVALFLVPLISSSVIISYFYNFGGVFLIALLLYLLSVVIASLIIFKK